MLLSTSFGDTIIDFGKQYGFNIWDWSAVLISFCSVQIAVVSLIVATKTLKSQRKTEKNTLPIINKSVQLSLLAQSLRGLFDSYSILFAFDYILYITEYKAKPSYHFWQHALLDESTIHESLFFSSSQKYEPIHQLKLAISEFNQSVISFKTVLNSSSESMKKMELNHLYDEIGYFISLYHAVLKETFQMKEENIIDFFDKNFFQDKRGGKFAKRFRSKYMATADTNSVLLPAIENSLSSQYLNDKFELFYEHASGDNLSKLNKKEFSHILSLHVDLILMNVHSLGHPIELTSKEDNHIKLKINPSPENSDSTASWTTPFPNIRNHKDDSNKKLKLLSTWIFYIE